MSSRMVSSRSGCPSTLSVGGDVPRFDPFVPDPPRRPPREPCGGDEEALWEVLLWEALLLEALLEALRSKTERRERRVSISAHSAGVMEWR